MWQRTDLRCTAEVDECPGVLRGTPQNVAGFEVAVDDALFMQCAHSLRHVQQHLHSRSCLKSTVESRQQSQAACTTEKRPLV